MALAVSACTGGGGTSGVEEGFVSGDGTITQVAPDEREAAPDVRGPLVGGDGEIALGDFDDQVVVLNVWASWCAPCRAESPDLVEAAARTEGIAQFVGLNAKEDNPAAEEAFLRAFEIPYPSLDDPTGELQLRFADNLPPSAIPSTLVIDREGRVAARVLGTISATTLADLVTDVSEGR
ncbi:Thiol-disulfide isomerase or thioredoxin [Auraticoccus monumenti]|uniref:Thiol-disulfide isomerase or thioredoxin n=1 Tax=Auraticoccus monumenti TaxID=675864 RepID=A0A1G6RIM6_9ACTN|nr:Thiol-disulfide isomerase or thioredoxin [Auraticoccus monumenti]